MNLINTDTICDNEDASMFKYECSQCGLDIEDACTCIWDMNVHYIDVYCHDCQDYHRTIPVEELIEHNWEDDEDDYYWDPARDTDGITGDDTLVGEYSYRLVHRCRHYNVPVEFPSGVTVYASSEHEREKHESPPDFGLYLDNLWRPECMAYTIEWPDMGLPKFKDVACKTIIDVYLKAKNGLWVEIGCIGGHGRTGTVLACMAVLAGMGHKEAVEFVKTQYCDSAIETERQEWFVEYFWYYINGGTTSKEPLYSKENEIIGPRYSFDGQLDWKDFNIFDAASGKPPEWMSETSLDEYAVKSWDTVSAGRKTEIIYPKDDNWNEVEDWMMAKYRELYPDDDADKDQLNFFEDMDLEDLSEDITEEMTVYETSDGPDWLTPKSIF